MAYDVPFSVTVRQIKHTIFECFLNSNIQKYVPIDLKIGTHTHWPDLYYVPCKEGIDQNNVTYVYMATKYPIIKHKAFFKTFHFLYL